MSSQRERTIPSFMSAEGAEELPLDALEELPSALAEGLVHTPQTGSTLLGPGPSGLKALPPAPAPLAQRAEVSWAGAPSSLLDGKYQLLGRVRADGAMFVLAAYHRGFDSEVALAFFRPELFSHEDALRLATQRFRAASRIRSEHVVRVFDLERLPSGQPFLVIERVRGYSLAVALRDRLRLTAPDAVELTLQLCEGLAHAHALGVVHGELSPRVLYLTNIAKEEQLKLLSLGAQHGKSPLVSHGRLGHEALYLAPEQLAQGSYDERADVWAVGCILHEMLCGSPVFRASSWASACAAVLLRPAVPVGSLRPDAPDGLARVVATCLAKDPGERFASLCELGEALAPFAPERALGLVGHIRRVLEDFRGSGGFEQRGFRDSGVPGEPSGLRARPVAQASSPAVAQHAPAVPLHPPARAVLQPLPSASLVEPSPAPRAQPSPAPRAQPSPAPRAQPSPALRASRAPAAHSRPVLARPHGPSPWLTGCVVVACGVVALQPATPHAQQDAPPPRSDDPVCVEPLPAYGPPAPSAYALFAPTSPHVPALDAASSCEDAPGP
jgi:eukaryotic-like serine/threonine-protein kinase